MDEVLANWKSAAIRLFDQDEEEALANWGFKEDITSVLGISEEKLWRKLDDAGADFWANLEPYPWANELWELCQSIAPSIILTSPSQDPFSLAGKLIWLNNQFGAPFRDYQMGPNKEFCARPGAVLIDDNQDNCDKFNANGGTAIVFPQPWNSLRRIKGDKMAFVTKALRRLEEK
jgi:5'(3')-deoxyribonucleotidase